MSNAAITSNVLPYQRPSFALPSRTDKKWAHDAHTGVDFHELFESVWMNSSDALRITDSKGVIIAVNDAFCRLVGMQTEELVGKPFTITYDGSVDPSTLLAEYYTRFNEGNISPVMNKRVRLRGGKEIYAETSNSFIKGSDGSTFVLTVIRDVSERHAAEEANKRAERLAEALYGISQAIYSTENIDELYQHIHGDLSSIVPSRNFFIALLTNNEKTLYFPYNCNEKGTDASLTIGADDPQSLTAEVLRSKRSLLLNEKELLDRYSSSKNRVWGGTAPKCWLGVPLMIREKAIGVMAVKDYNRGDVYTQKDVALFESAAGQIAIAIERKRAEEALASERNLLRVLIDNLPDLIYFKDAGGRYVLNNRAHLRSIGAAAQESALGKTTFDFNPPELAEQYSEDEMRIVQTGEPLLGKEELALHKDTGEQRWHLTSKIPLANAEGTVTGIVGISRDVTENKELEIRVQDSLTALQASRESLAQLNAQKDRLFSVLSHDLRSPFTSILGFCEILITDGETLTDAERSEFLTYIRDGAKRQLALLNKLLDWSRLETGRVKLNVQDIDLDIAALNSVTTHLGTSKQKDIKLQSTLPAGMKILGDEDLLMQLFNNLISNALKFTPANGTISIDLTEEKDEEWIVAVKDTGRGIPKEDLKKLFKVEEKYTRPGLQGEQGTGLGLSLVHEIMKQHSGSISVDSEVGQGTTFTLRFPRLIEIKEHVVMVVDDDEGIRVLHSRYLKGMYPDAQVITASNGKEAFELAKKCRPRLIVTDYSMPEMNGYELLNLLKGEPSTKHIPVFVITGKGSTASTDTLLFSGAAAVLNKPIPRKELQETIEKTLAQRI